MKKLCIMFFLAIAIGVSVGHFISDKPWGNTLVTTGKAIIFYGLWAEEYSDHQIVYGHKYSTIVDSIMFWGFVVIGSIVWATTATSKRREARLRSVDIVCAKCEQYLGTAAGFDSPCPRCGSNRYRRE